MTETPLYSIGHGSRKAEDFLELLKKFGIDYLIDVRSKPYSRFHPQFSRNNLEVFLKENDINYVFMGDCLGGRPDDPDCYDESGRVNYEVIKRKESFKQGILRLETACNKKLKAAIMCSERDPRQCHRTWMVGIALDAAGIRLLHIDELGELRSQEEVSSRM